MKKVIIGIQARSGSTRLPNKCLLKVGSHPILEWVLQSCRSAAAFLNRSDRLEIKVTPVLLLPANDPLNKLYHSEIDIVSHEDENDVLTRYVKAQEAHGADYIVRVTADCLRMKDYIISRAVKQMLKRSRFPTPYEFVTNAIERTAMEGLDCEVMTAEMLKWLDENAVTAFHREHVTVMIREMYLDHTFPFKICHLLDDDDYSDVKTSIDTQEEYDAAVANMGRVFTKKREINSRGDFYAS